MLIAVICIIILAGLLAYILDATWDETCCMAVFAIIAVLYVGGIIGLLEYGSIAIVIASFCGGIVCLGDSIKKHKLFRWGKIYKTKGTLALLAMLVVWLVLIRDRNLLYWDEFSHWGLVVKNMWILDDMPYVKESAVTFKSYPPGIALFQYFFVDLFRRGFRECLLYYAYSFMAYSFLMPFYSYAKKNAKLIWLVFLLVPLIFRKNYYSNILCEGMLGVLYFAMLGHGMLREEARDRRINTIYLLMLSALLPMIKSAGYGLVLICILMHMLVWLKGGNKKYCWISLACVVVASVSRISWNLCLKCNDIDTSFYSLGFGGRTGSEIIEIIKVYLSELFTGKKSLEETILPVVLWCVLLVIAEYILRKRGFKQMYLLVGVGTYLIFLIYIYIYNMSLTTALTLASFPRYIAPILLGSCMLVAFLIMSHGNAKIKIVSCSIVILLAIPNMKTQLYNIDETIEKTKTLQDGYYCKEMEELTSDDRVCFIAQNTYGTPYNMAIYVNTPVHYNICKSYSIGTPSDEADYVTQWVSKDEFRDFISNECEYVFIYQGNEEFVQLYGEFFRDELEARTLYRVVKDGQNVYCKRVSR